MKKTLIKIFIFVGLIGLFPGVVYLNQLKKDNQPVNNISVVNMERWVDRYKDNPEIITKISKSVEDGIVTNGEYYSILTLVVSENEKRAETEKEQVIKSLQKLLPKDSK